MSIEHDPIGQKFFMPLDNNEEAVIGYTQVNKILDIHHIFVPASNRSEGMAEQLALFAFSFARKNGYKIIPSCPYIKDTFLPRHPEFSDIILEDWE